MSYEQKNYLKNIKKKKRLIILSQLGIIIFFLVLWEFLTRKEIINPFIYSSPSKIIHTISNLYKTNNLFIHIYITIKEVFIAFFLSITIAFLISIIFYEVPILAKIFDPFLTILNSLPKVALGPIIIIICGANIKSIIVMAILINLIVSIITIYNGFQNIDKIKVKLFKTFNASKKDTLFKLIIPQSYNTIISSLKLSISLTLIGLLPPVGEKVIII